MGGQGTHGLTVPLSSLPDGHGNTHPGRGPRLRQAAGGSGSACPVSGVEGWAVLPVVLLRVSLLRANQVNTQSEKEQHNSSGWSVPPTSVQLPSGGQSQFLWTGFQDFISRFRNNGYVFM